MISSDKLDSYLSVSKHTLIIVKCEYKLLSLKNQADTRPRPIEKKDPLFPVP